jgi:hypothetical protein
LAHRVGASRAFGGPVPGRNQAGNRTVRAIQPRQLYGRWLDSWCHLRNAQRDFTVANIESVARWLIDYRALSRAPTPSA